MKNRDKCTCNKRLSLSHSQQMSKDVNADHSNCNTDWPHVWSVPVCGPCNLFSNQHPTSTVTIQPFPQQSFHFSSNCLWLSTDHPSAHCQCPRHVCSRFWSQTIRPHIATTTCMSGTVNPFTLLQDWGRTCAASSCHKHPFWTLHIIDCESEIILSLIT